MLASSVDRDVNGPVGRNWLRQRFQTLNLSRTFLHLNRATMFYWLSYLVIFSPTSSLITTRYPFSEQMIRFSIAYGNSWIFIQVACSCIEPQQTTKLPDVVYPSYGIMFEMNGCVLGVEWPITFSDLHDFGFFPDITTEITKLSQTPFPAIICHRNSYQLHNTITSYSQSLQN